MEKRRSARIADVLAGLFILFTIFGAVSLAAEKTDSGKERSDVEIPVNHLRVQLRPLDVEQLEAELETWIKLLKAKITEVGEVEIEIETRSEEEEEKESLNSKLLELRTQEADLIERTQIVVEALSAKGGETSEVEAYLAAISDISASGDVETQTAAISAAIRSWLASPDGGRKLVQRAIVAVVIFLIFWIISRFAGRLVGRWLEKRSSVSELLTTFCRKTSGFVVLVVGILMALSALGVSIGPLMAALGAGGFIVGFALQETLSNFASGMMIMVYRPFDVNDYVSIAGDEGVVKEMTLVSTTILTLDNKVLIIPNKTVWGNTITNYTGEDIRRVDMSFGIGYSDHIPAAMAVLEEMAKAHPLTLDDPGVTVEVLELADSSVNLGCWPWVKSRDYWSVKWDLTKEIKMRFDKEGISIPFPQRDVHMVSE